MKIVWHQNPLRTVIELDDCDRWWLREVMELDMDPDDTSHLAWMNELHSAYQAELLSVHGGDCTCVAISCLKCWAEGYLGIDTIPGLEKHMAHKIDGAFRPELTIDEAIAKLANYDPKPGTQYADKMDIWNAHLPRWREEARRAHDWLVRYRDEHFGKAKP